MKAVILAGGFGTRISEESYLKPKPMVGIGEMPILWHIMKIYSQYGINDFIVCLGYKGYVIKEFFANYFLYSSDVTFDFSNNNMEVHRNTSENWKVTLVETGLNTMTGGRIKRIEKYIGKQAFCLTYGDGIADINISELIDYHKNSGKIVTMTAVNADQRFGVLNVTQNNEILEFREKAKKDNSLINGGFMVAEPEVFQYLENDETIFEQKPLETLASERQLNAYIHTGFWKCMDTKRDKDQLEAMWNSGNAPWKIWE